MRRRTGMLRIVAYAVFGILIVCLALWSIRARSREEEPQKSIYYTSVRIEPGDTLTSIACEFAPRDDEKTVRSYMEQLAKINNLGSRDILKAGNYLTIYYYK